MLRRALLIIGLVVGAVVATLALAGAVPQDTRQGNVITSPNIPPDKVRFRLVGDEPIAGPDGRSVVAGWKVIVLKDMVSGTCRMAFLAGASLSVSDSGVCP